MNKTLIWFLVGGVLLFAALWVLFTEVSMLPMLVLCNVVVVGIRYAVDRWGFKKVDTHNVLSREWMNGNTRPYIDVMWQYTLLVLAVSVAVLFSGSW